MSANACPKVIVIGSGPVATVLAQVLRGMLLPEAWLRSGHMEQYRGFSNPLIQCEWVLHLVSSGGECALDQWRKQRCWKLFGDNLGDGQAERGLRWVTLVPGRDGFKVIRGEAASNDNPAGGSVGLGGILSAMQATPSLTYSSWLAAWRNDTEVKLRLEMRNLLNQTPCRETVSAIQFLAGQLSPLQWERYCPPPDFHCHANQIRRWLLKPVPEPVTQWFLEGRCLLQDLNLTP